MTDVHPSMVLDHLRARLAERPPGPLFVGFSGGLDSTVLAHALVRLLGSHALQLLHVDHQLQPDSAHWAVQAVAFAAQLQVEIQPLAVKVDLQAGLGLEGAARAARYAAFAAATPGDAVIALAHHRQDQAETLLLRLMRGSGSTALAGMKALRRFEGQRWLWRPLLDLDRPTLLRYAEAERLQWLDDPANQRLDLDRNWIRHRVLPALAERWPQADLRLTEAAERLAAEAVDRERLADQRLAAAATLAPEVRRGSLWRGLDRYALGEVLRAWCRRLDYQPPPASVIARLHALLNPAAETGAEDGFRLGWAELELRSHRDLLRLAPPTPPLQCGPARWTGMAEFRLPSGAALRLEPAATEPQDWQVRARLGGERIELPCRQHSSELKKCLQALGLPPWEREQLPLLWSAEGQLLAAGDVLLSARMEDWLRAQQTRLRWILPHKGADESASGS